MGLVSDAEKLPPLQPLRQNIYNVWSNYRLLRVLICVCTGLFALVLSSLQNNIAWSFLLLVLALVLLVDTLLQSLSEILVTVGVATFGIFGGLTISQLLLPAAARNPYLESLFTRTTEVGIIAALIGIVLRETINTEVALYQNWLLTKKQSAVEGGKKFVAEPVNAFVEEEKSVTWSLIGFKHTKTTRCYSRIPVMFSRE